jgi:hypothetical protein
VRAEDRAGGGVSALLDEALEEANALNGDLYRVFRMKGSIFVKQYATRIGGKVVEEMPRHIAEIIAKRAIEKHLGGTVVVSPVRK